MHQITLTGAQWEHQRGRTLIEANEIFVVSAPKSRGEYIVTLLHEGDEENPVVLGECLFGRVPLPSSL
jgi:hypothetical protein